jgi:hypothetical protein
MILIGVSGKMGVGKNYVTENYLLPKLIDKFSNDEIQYVPYFVSFGTQVKIELYSRDTNNYLNYSNLFIKKSNYSRETLQKYATESGRDKYRKDMWIRAVDMWIAVQKDNLEIVNKHLSRKLVPIFVVEDVRFENEYEYIKSNSGILVLVESRYRNFQRCLYEINNGNKDFTHESEKGLEHLEFHLRINNEPVNSDTIEFNITEFIDGLVVPVKPYETK